MTGCELCDLPGGEVLARTAQYRVVLVDDPDFPGFTRVIWNDHVREMTDLDGPDRAALMQAVWRVEALMREILRPTKINLASLGNVVAHLHWHVIPRWSDDSRFPHPIWAPPHGLGRFEQRPSAVRVRQFADHLTDAFASVNR
jgi:diadenosine tetraphosphate (Ap4A) HIT family hydrolase